MKSVKCPNCGNEIVVDESSQYLSCGSCGKCYVNPYYVEKKSADTVDTESTSFDSDKSEHANPVLRCVSCSATLPSDDSSPTLTCPACGRNHKNPFYKPTQAAIVQENTKQNNKDDTRVISWAYCPQCGNSLDLRNGKTEAYCDQCKKNFVVKRTQDGTIHLEGGKQVINVQQNIVNIQQNIVTAPAKVGESKFTGTYGSLLGNRIVNSLISIFTLGFGIPWVICRSYRWEVDHTVIDGRRLKFDGTGGKLIGSWIKWMFLTLITCGIYGLWVPLKKRAWIVEHSHIEGLAGESKFTGGLASFLGLQIVNFFILIFTLGLGVPWVVCRSMKWDSEHQIIDGRRIYFDGNAAQLFGNWIKWILLTFITCGFYGFLLPIKKQAWIVKHQSFVKPVGNSGQSTGKLVDVNSQKKKDIGKIVGCVLAVVCVIAVIVVVCVTVIPKATHQHSWVWIVDEEATAIETGLKHEECSVCHAKQNENTIIDARGFAGLAYSINKDGETCTITGIGNFTGSNVTIPEEIDGYVVTGIGDRAFYDCDSLTSITIPDSVTSIGDYAFYDCTSLTSITIPDSVTNIRHRAFYDCANLTSVTIGSGVTSIGDDAFRNCDNLTSVIFGENSKLTTIGYGAFEYCTSLTSITIPDSVTSIREAFNGCSSLESLTIPFVGTGAGITNSDGYQPFGYIFGTSSYTGGTEVRQNVSESVVMYFCIPSSLRSVTVTGGNILQTAFEKCSMLTSITISDGVTSLGDWAFYDCTNLTSVTFGENSQLTSIGSCAFSQCSSLTRIIVPDSVTRIGSWAFADCCSLTSITIPNSVTSIGYGAFEGCTSLTSVTIPNSVTDIGNYAFRGCSRLTSVTFKANSRLTTIGDYAFYNCTSLTDVYYEGTEEQWNAISIGSNNLPLTNATRRYYSECVHDNNQWRYDAAGNISTMFTVGDDGVCTVCGEELYTITNDATYAFVETDGVLESTNKAHSSSSSYVITANTTITITFEYNVSSESSYDKFYIYHNTTQKVVKSGTSNSYTSYSITLNAGDTLTFKYTKDGSQSSGADCCYIKNLTITEVES